MFFTHTPHVDIVFKNIRKGIRSPDEMPDFS